MSRLPIPTATVALVAAQIYTEMLGKKMLSPDDLSNHRDYGTGKTFFEGTITAIAGDAWRIVKAVEETRPTEYQ